MVRLIAPLAIVGSRPGSVKVPQAGLTQQGCGHVLFRREVSFDLHAGSPTYMDASGEPRGVPNRYNYVHYNILRLTNMTRDAVQGLSEQLCPHFPHGHTEQDGPRYAVG